MKGTGASSAEAGFALIAALWLLVALSAIGLEFGIRARARRLEVANAVEISTAQAAAEGGLADVQARLTGRMLELRQSGSGDPNRLIDPWGDLVLSFRGRLAEPGDDFSRKSTGIHTTGIDPSSVVELKLMDAGAFLNLNTAPEDQLRRFFIALRVDMGTADRIAQAITDWKDADHAHRPRGAEVETYLAAGAPRLPADAPFEQVSDLRFVRGVTSELYDLASPFLTLTGSGRINANQAPGPVLLSLPGLSDAAVSALGERARSDHPIRNLNDLLLELSEGARAALQAAGEELNGKLLFETQEVLATATAQAEGSPVAGMAQGLFVRSGDAVFLTWRRSE